MKVAIVDNAFAHCLGCSLRSPPSHFEWIRGGQAGDVDTVFFTDRLLHKAPEYSAANKVAWLIEPDGVYSGGYEHIRQHIHQFTCVLSYDQRFRELNPDKILYYAIGGCWIPKNDRKLWPKSRLVSMIASDKRGMPGYELRYDARERLLGQVAVFGRGVLPISDKTVGLADYAFSIAIENMVVDGFFTEKLIDCFLTGTVPIYWGHPCVADRFNMDGIITFNTVDELEAIVRSLTPDLYRAKADAIADNFARAHQYLSPEDWIFKHYPFLFV